MTETIDTQKDATATKPDADLEKNNTDKLRSEAAGYRTGRNEALKKVALFEAMLKRHNIDIPKDIDETMKNLEIENGEVITEIDYQPKRPAVSFGHDSKEKKQVKSVAPPVTATDSNPITKDSLADMSPEDINKNWETVQKLLKQPK